MRSGIWHRVLAALVLTVFLFGTTVQTFASVSAAQPCTMMVAEMPSDTWAMAGDDENDADSPNAAFRVCPEAFRCVVSATLSNTPASECVPMEWNIVLYSSAQSAMTGDSPGPELEPPIVI